MRSRRRIRKKEEARNTTETVVRTDQIPLYLSFNVFKLRQHFHIVSTEKKARVHELSYIGVRGRACACACARACACETCDVYMECIHDRCVCARCNTPGACARGIRVAYLMSTFADNNSSEGVCTEPSNCWYVLRK